MEDVFETFIWTVAPSYEWRDWLSPVGIPRRTPDRGFFSLESPSAVEGAWNRNAEQKRRVGPVLQPVVEKSQVIRRYHPLDRDHAALFREFGDLDYRSRDAMLGFAKQYGLLGLKTQSQIRVIPAPEGPSRTHHAAGESLLDWALEICLMNEGIGLSGAERDEEDTRRMQWLFNRQLQNVQGRIVLTPAATPRLILTPLSLLSAMWLQLARDVTGDKRFVRCKFCYRLFEISKEQTGFRRHREFCSGSCKTLDYRKRRATALQLAKAGAVASDIATRIETEPKTVERWLASQGAHARRTSKKGDA